MRALTGFSLLFASFGSLQCGSNPETRAKSKELYQQALTEYQTFSAGSAERARPLLDSAFRLDSSFAPSWVLLARLSPAPSAKTFALKALQLDSGYAPALAALADIQWRQEWDFDRAEANLRKAIALDPNLPQAYAWLGRLLTTLGRHDEAITTGLRAREIDGEVYGDGHTQALIAAGRYDDAIAAARSGLAADSNQTGNLYYQAIGYALLAKGRIAVGHPLRITLPPSEACLAPT